MRKLEIDDFKHYTFLSGLKISPDGENAALVRTKVNDENGYDSHIFVMHGEKPVQFTSGGKERSFIWDSDKSILFPGEPYKKFNERQKEGAEVSSFYRLPIDGGEARHAFTLPVTAGQLEKIGEGLYAVLANVSADRTDFSPINIYKTQEYFTNRKKEQELCQIIDEVPFWSNGNGFINKIRGRLFIWDENKCTLMPLSPPDTDVFCFKISSGGEFAAFAALVEKNGVKALKSDIYLCNLKDFSVEKISEQKLFVYDFDFWGKNLLIAGSKQEKYGINENASFYLLDTAAKTLSLLSEYDYSSIESTVCTDCRYGSGTGFKVDGDKLYFVSTVDFSADLFALDLRTGEIERMTNCGGSLDFFDIKNNKILSVAMLPGKLQELYQLEMGELKMRSSFNTALQNELIYIQPEHLSFKETEDFEIDGWVIIPVKYKKGKKYPAILNIHGGPKTVHGDIYFHELQFWSSKGYFVIYCNPRGSDGKGNAFADIRGKYGRCDYDNIIQFLDEILKKYSDIDVARLGVAGGSYGGFMTNWIIGHTDKFKAAVSQRGISSWQSMETISDIGYFFSPDQTGIDIFGNKDELWAQSPLSYSPNCKTPTLFIHSEEDYRCYMVESLQMFSALKRHGIDTKICLFRGENHELSRSGKPESRIRRMQEIIGWIDRYV
ncbi:MAG: S9 family peptidase [Oscillospiraceae bacterium]|jgi:dipeptidyl aminopeptidase/acylaminoacyl peptidase|nr:S9 family peptidase [Oscillospiraceae bacterium]